MSKVKKKKGIIMLVITPSTSYLPFPPSTSFFFSFMFYVRERWEGGRKGGKEEAGKGERREEGEERVEGGGERGEKREARGGRGEGGERGEEGEARGGRGGREEERDGGRGGDLLHLICFKPR